MKLDQFQEHEAFSPAFPFSKHTGHPLIVNVAKFLQQLFDGMDIDLGSRLIDQSQKMTVAASAIAEKKTVGHRS